MTVLGQNGISTWTLGNTLIPAEGMKAICTVLNFGTDNTFDMAQQNLVQNTAPFSMVQTVFVDTSNTDDPVVITCGKGGQQIVAKGRTQGYYPVIAPNNWDLSFFCSDAGGPLVFVALCNFQVQPAVWPTH
jgi:hypothetical protein